MAGSTGARANSSSKAWCPGPVPGPTGTSSRSETASTTSSTSSSSLLPPSGSASQVTRIIPVATFASPTTVRPQMTSPSSQPMRSMSKKVEVDLGRVAAPRAGLVVGLLGLADRFHVLAGGFDAHALKGTLNGVLSYPPGILARGPWPPDRVTSRWSETPYEPPPEQDRRGRPRDRRAERPRLALARRARRPAGRASPLLTGELRLELAGDALGAAAAARGRVGRALGAVRRARLTRAAGSRAGARSGWRRGRACGRSARAERSTQARIRRLRSVASCSRNGRSSPSGSTVEALVATPGGHGDADRPGVARARRRGDPRPRARRTRMVAARPRPTGQKRHIRNFGAWQRC